MDCDVFPILGVADQLQTNYASDLRNILKSVFDMNCSQSQILEKCDNSTSDVFNEIESFTEGSFNENSTILNSNLSGTILNNNTGDEDERDRSSVDSAEEVVPDNSLSSPLVISEVTQENENNRNIHTGMSVFLIIAILIVYFMQYFFEMNIKSRGKKAKVTLIDLVILSTC